jgi:uncharacterized membrane protein
MSTPASPTNPPPPSDALNDPGLSSVVHKNIASLTAVRRQENAARPATDRIADAITAFAGSMWCVYVHALAFGVWLLLNARFVPFPYKWDPYPYVMLAMTASVEAIFLSTFILVTQNRMQRTADRRAELDLQISLLAEHELTRAIRLIDSIAVHLHAPRLGQSELDEIKHDVNPEKVARQIERAEDHPETLAPPPVDEDNQAR